MSMERLKKERENKPFRKADLIIYLVLTVVIVILFVVFVINSGSSQSQGFEIVLNETVIFQYDFDSDSYSIANGYENVVLVDTQNGFYITVYTDNGKHYNKISVDKDKKQILMADANCSSSKDCTKMSISDDKGVIICVPNGIMVRSKSQRISQPTSG